MAYVVLARKYRPRTFESMVGQDAAVRALGNALKQQRLHHAYLFTGTRGIGKTTVSRIFAKCLNCLGADGAGGITAVPCGGCTACTQIDEDRFIDYIELDAASNRGIAEIRDLLDRAAYKPSVGRFKVFMIDEAHQLTKESFNALLKTLEEPPEYVKFVLATTDPQKMPATVLSRCLQFNLRPMAPQTVREHLAQVLAAEGVEHDDASLIALGRAAQGSMRDALSLTDQAIAFGGGTLKGEAVRAMLGSVGREPAMALVEALSQRDAKQVLAHIDALRAQGLSPDGTLEAMATVLQDMAVEQAVAGAVDATLPDVEGVRRLATAMPSDDTQLLYSIVLHGRREINLAPDGYAGLTMVLLRLLAFDKDDAPSPLQARASGAGDAPERSVSARNLAATQAVHQATPAVARASAAVPVQPKEAPVALSPSVGAVNADASHSATAVLAKRWHEVVSSLVASQSITAMVRELAMQSALVAVDETVTPPLWRLVVERDSLRTTAAQDKLAVALSTLLGAEQCLEVQAGAAQDTPAQRDAAARERRAIEAERVVREDPLVQDMLSQFKTARIVPGSIKTTQEFKP